MNLSDIIDSVEAVSVSGPAMREVSSLTFDSRTCREGSIFVAVSGAEADGHRYIASAVNAGAVAVVYQDGELDSADFQGATMIKVADSRLALSMAADRWYDHPSGKLQLVGITGTNGKTTTKELVAAVLSQKYNVLYTQGNFNNDVGVPKTLFRLTKEHEIAVIEMGASHPGDIKTLAETAEPTCGLITNVGKAHLQGFGSFEGVRRAKGELYRWLGSHEGSVIFLNEDDPDLVRMARAATAVA